MRSNRETASSNLLRYKYVAVLQTSCTLTLRVFVLTLAMSSAAKTSFRLLVLVLVLDLVVLTLAYPPACNVYYGRPNYLHCRSIIRGRTSSSGIINVDRQHHFFGVSGIERPPEISALEVCVCF